MYYNFKNLNQVMFFLTFILVCSCKIKDQGNVMKERTEPKPHLAHYTKPEGRKFLVDDVVPADFLLKTDIAKNVFENKIDKQILYFPEEFTNQGLVPCENNGFIQTIQECYSNHRPLMLSPDAIWLAICQGVSIHINEKIDSLEQLIFIKNKPGEIEVRNDDLVKGGSAWKALINSFSVETKNYTRADFYSFFVSQFSTTTEVEKTAYQITLLESYKKVFQYTAESGCGIPSITITGEKKDWQLILSRLEMLDKLGLSHWHENLKPVITEFINVLDGQVNQDFWKSIYKDASEYGAYYISGWILKFFPYVKVIGNDRVLDEKTGEELGEEKFVPNEFIEGNRYLFSTLSTDNFPSGIAKINVTWNNYFKGETKKMEVYAGYFAMRQYPDKTLEPVISWVVCDKKAQAPRHKSVENHDHVKVHTSKLWSPKIADSLTDLAVYDIKRFKDQRSSLDYLRNRILEAVQEQPSLRNKNLSGDTLTFVVLCDGSVDKFELLGRNFHQEVLDFMEHQIKSLPEKWFPALTYPTHVLELMDDLPEKELKTRIKVHSLIRISLDQNNPTKHKKS